MLACLALGNMGPAWFETALTRLLTMRIEHLRHLRGPHPEEREARLEGWATTGLVTPLIFPAAHGVRVFPSIYPHRKQRAQGRPGALRTHGPRATKKHAAEPQVRAGMPGLPCAMVLTACFVLSPVRPGFVVTVALRHLAKRGTCIGAPGPHDFAVRDSLIRLVRHRVHRIPLPTSVTIAKRPSCGSETCE